MGMNKIMIIIVVLLIGFSSVSATIYEFDDLDGSSFFSLLNWNMITALDWSNVTINQSQITDLSVTGGQWEIDNFTLINVSDVLQVNETWINNTIDARASGGAGKEGDGIYLYNNTDTMFFNETKLNQTIGNLTSTLGVITELNLTTVDTYNGSLSSGSLTGYEAANDICNTEFTGTHLCTEFEVSDFINNGNISTVTGLGRVIAGGAKFVPADLPVNDCQGLTYDGTTEAQGNFWNFDVGYGVAANCAVESALSCCR